MASTARQRHPAEPPSRPDGAAETWSAAPRVSLHVLDQEAVLFDEASSRAYALNSAATLIWCLLEEGLSVDAMAGELAARAGIDRLEAASRIGVMLREWRAFGLLAGAQSLREPRVTPMPRRAPGTPRAPVPAGTGPVLRARILDTAIEVRLPSAHWQGQLRPFLEPFADDASGTDRDVEIVLRLVADDDGLAWHGPDGALSPAIAPNRVAPYFKMLLVEQALRHSHDAGALHAAAMGRKGRCVLLPGNAGSGKSTLAAGLMAAGFEFLGDDTVVFDRATLALRPIPFPICTKPGAWDVLEGRFLSLRAQPVHVRADRKRVRYLHAATAAPPSARYDVAAIVFPSWGQDSTLSLTPLARPRALQRLLAGFCPLGPTLSAAEMGRLVAWIAARECYELRYGRLDEAVNSLQALLP